MATGEIKINPGWRPCEHQALYECLAHRLGGWPWPHSGESSPWKIDRAFFSVDTPIKQAVLSCPMERPTQQETKDVLQLMVREELRLHPVAHKKLNLPNHHAREFGRRVLLKSSLKMTTAPASTLIAACERPKLCPDS